MTNPGAAVRPVIAPSSPYRSATGLPTAKASLLDIVGYGDEEEEDADEPPQRQP
jgi:hypothetical protein